jgi:hypothetical protein
LVYLFSGSILLERGITSVIFTLGFDLILALSRGGGAGLSRLAFHHDGLVVLKMERQRETKRDKDRQRETKRDKERQRETKRDKERQRETKRDKERQVSWASEFGVEWAGVTGHAVRSSGQ